MNSLKKILLFLAIIPLCANAQKSTAFWEFGAYVGTLNYKGEITQEGDIGTWLNEARPEFGLLLKRNFNERVALGVEAGWGKIFADDNNHGMPERNYVVNTQMVQANMIFDFNFKKFGKYFKRNANTPYLRAGLGMLFYSPHLNENANYPPEYNLYDGTFSTFNFQTAIGWKWRISNNSIIGVQLHYHFTGATHLEGFDLAKGLNPTDAFYGLKLIYSYGIF